MNVNACTSQKTAITIEFPISRRRRNAESARSANFRHNATRKTRERARHRLKFKASSQVLRTDSENSQRNASLLLSAPELRSGRSDVFARIYTPVCAIRAVYTSGEQRAWLCVGAGIDAEENGR